MNRLNLGKCETLGCTKERVLRQRMCEQHAPTRLDHTVKKLSGWILTCTSQGVWQLPPEGVDVILRIGSQYLVGYLLEDAEDGAYFHVEGPLDCLDYTLDNVRSWRRFTKPLGE